MRSSKGGWAAWARWAGWGSACAAALVACGAPASKPPADALPAVAIDVACLPDSAALPPARAAELSTLRRSIETGPLYAAVAAGRAPQCSVSAEGSQWQIAYRFAADAALRVTLDGSIEYTDYTATVNWPAGEAAPTLLMRHERTAFAPAGCGIDWQAPEIRPTEATPPGRQRMWRGDTCNCQGRVVEDGTGRVRAVGWRSAC